MSQATRTTMWYWWMVVAVTATFSVALQGRRCDACFEGERIALLQLQESINSSYESSLFFDGSGSENDCCRLERVACNPVSGRVMELSLNVSGRSEDWQLNASLFLPFAELTRLYLYGNHITGFVGRLSGLTNLEMLDLGSNPDLNISILSSLAALPALRILDLSSNSLLGSVNNLTGFQNLRKLERLDVSYSTVTDSFLDAVGKISSLKSLVLKGCGLAGGMEGFVGRLSGLTNLETLDLGSNRDLNISILSSLAALPSLRILDLSSNSLLGSVNDLTGLQNLRKLERLDVTYSTVTDSFLDTVGKISSLRSLILKDCGLAGGIEGLCQLKHLQELDLSTNDLYGELPSCLANLTSLTSLDLSDNHFTGDMMANSPLRSLLSIRHLLLSGNNFQMPISLTPFFNHSNLQQFEARNTFLTGAYAKNEEYSVPKFQLQTLDLSSGQSLVPGQPSGVSRSFPRFVSRWFPVLVAR